MQRHCLTLDLKDDPLLIAEYEAHHRSVWPEVLKSIHDSGIQRMEIYRAENRLCMVIDADEGFSFEAKRVMDETNPVVQRWETLMWKYQQAIPNARPGEKWRVMERIFEL